MIKFYSVYVLLAGLIIILLTACNQSSGKVNSELNGLEAIIPEGAGLEKITKGYSFDTAGSPLYLNGSLYFTNNNFDSPDEFSRTFRMSEDGSIDTLINGNNVTTTLVASGKGTIYACEMLGHRVTELDENGQVLSTIAGQYDGVRIDGPNDLVVDKKGGIYFSDSQFIAGREKMQPHPAVYYVTPEHKIIRVIDDVEFPNGLGLSPDGRTLYVANTQGRHLLAYEVYEDGTLGNDRKFGKFELAEGSDFSGADGIAVDSAGNIYVATTQGLGVQVFSSSGIYLGNIEVPSPANNVAFGGEEGRTLFISVQDGIYQIPVNIQGIVF